MWEKQKYIPEDKQILVRHFLWITILWSLFKKCTCICFIFYLYDLLFIFFIIYLLLLLLFYIFLFIYLGFFPNIGAIFLLKLPKFVLKVFKRANQKRWENTKMKESSCLIYLTCSRNMKKLKHQELSAVTSNPVYCVCGMF